MNKQNNEFKDNIPEIYCAISILIKKDSNINEILNKLRSLGIINFDIHTPKCENERYIDIAIIKNEKSWYLDDVLRKMFYQVDDCLIELKQLIYDFGERTYIDIAFYQYGTYPALEFVGENMKKIRFLEAENSIDAY